MNVFSLALANVRALRRRLFGLVALVSVAAAVCLGALGIADRAQSVTDSGVKESSANRSVTVDRPDSRPDTPQLTDRTAARLAKLPHVESVQHRAQVSFGVLTKAGDTVLLYATTYRPALPPPVTKSVRKQLFPLRPGEIVAPAASQGADLSKLVGQEVEIETTRFVRQGEGTGVSGHARLVGVYDPTWQLDNPDAAYAADSTVVKWAAQRSGEPEKSYLSTVGYPPPRALTLLLLHHSTTPRSATQPSPFSRSAPPGPSTDRSYVPSGAGGARSYDHRISFGTPSAVPEPPTHGAGQAFGCARVVYNEPCAPRDARRRRSLPHAGVLSRS